MHGDPCMHLFQRLRNTKITCNSSQFGQTVDILVVQVQVQVLVYLRLSLIVHGAQIYVKHITCASH